MEISSQRGQGTAVHHAAAQQLLRATARCSAPAGAPMPLWEQVPSPCGACAALHCPVAPLGPVHPSARGWLWGGSQGSSSPSHVQEPQPPGGQSAVIAEVVTTRGLQGCQPVLARRSPGATPQTQGPTGAGAKGSPWGHVAGRGDGPALHCEGNPVPILKLFPQRPRAEFTFLG